MTTRRAFIATLAGGLLAAPLAAPAQQAGKIPKIGIITVVPSRLDSFRRGLRELGYVDGQNITIEYRSAEGQPEHFADLIAELVALKVDVMVVGSGNGARAAKNAMTSIPVVFVAVADPVGADIVASLARPGGNITGVSLALGEQFSGKWVELLKDAVPKVTRIAVLVNPLNVAYSTYLREMSAAARARGAKLLALEVRDIGQLGEALAAITRDRTGGLVVAADPLFDTQQTRSRIMAFAARQRLPTIYFTRELVEAGGLMSYGPSISDQFRSAAVYADKILKGAKPADLPVEQPTKFELVINLKAARALGLTIPQSVLLRADEVIR